MTQDDTESTAQFVVPRGIRGRNRWLTMSVEPGGWSVITQQSRHHEDLCWIICFCLTCMDWKTPANGLSSYIHHVSAITMVIKSKLDANKPGSVPATHIWKTARFEREVYEMFGVRFESSDLLADFTGWVGRQEPVNMKNCDGRWSI